MSLIATFMSAGSGYKYDNWAGKFSSAVLEYTYDMPNGSYSFRLKPDGTGFLFINGDELRKTVAIDPFNIEGLNLASSDRTYVDVGTLVGSTNGTAWPFSISPDGTRVLIVNEASRVVYALGLDAPWEPQTATNRQNRTFPTIPNGIRGFDVKPDGTRLYVLDASDNLYQLDMSVPWSLDDLTYNSVLFDTDSDAAGDAYRGLKFAPDGKTFFSHNSTQYELRKFTMTTAWDVSTASYSGEKLSISGFGATGFDISPDGTALYINDASNSGAKKYRIG